MEASIRVAIESQQRNLAAQTRFPRFTGTRPGATILDIGCGPGLACAYFKDRGLVPTGLDNWPNIFQYGDQIEFVEEMKALEGRQFDYVLASHILEHCPNTFKTLAEWRDLVVDDGHIIIIVPPQIPYVANDHRIMGWKRRPARDDAGRRGIRLPAVPFPAAPDGAKICGWGKKREFPDTQFNIQASLPYLPAGVRTEYPLLLRLLHPRRYRVRGLLRDLRAAEE